MGSKAYKDAMAFLDKALDDILDVGKQSSGENQACYLPLSSPVRGNVAANSGSMHANEYGYSEYYGTLVNRPRVKPKGRAAYRDIGGADGHLANRRAFRGNSMYAVHVERRGRIDSFGRLPLRWTNKLGLDRNSADLYLVFSYHTPIAWVLTECGRVVIPDAGYSVTTTRQQGLCRAWLR